MNESDIEIGMLRSLKLKGDQLAYNSALGVLFYSRLFFPFDLLVLHSFVSLMGFLGL